MLMQLSELQGVELHCIHFSEVQQAVPTLHGGELKATLGGYLQNV